VFVRFCREDQAIVALRIPGGVRTMNSKSQREISTVDADAIRKLYQSDGDSLHRKIDETRDAYFGFIFPVTRSDLYAVASALGVQPSTADAIFSEGRSFSTFAPEGRRPTEITNHIVGATLLAARGKNLDDGLGSVDDKTVVELVRERESEVLEVAAARSEWFGRIYFPCQAFANALGVFGGRVSPEAFFALGQQYGYAARAGKRQTVRGDFGIAVWLTLLAFAP
jgi:hypothetical protein